MFTSSALLSKEAECRHKRTVRVSELDRQIIYPHVSYVFMAWANNQNNEAMIEAYLFSLAVTVYCGFVSVAEASPIASPKAPTSTLKLGLPSTGSVASS